LLSIYAYLHILILFIGPLDEYADERGGGSPLASLQHSLDLILDLISVEPPLTCDRLQDSSW